MASKDELQELKADWQSDPSYQIEDALVFEEHRDELRAWRLIYEADSEAMDRMNLVKRARESGRSPESQEAFEREIVDERRHREAACVALEQLFYAAGLRWYGPGPQNLPETVANLVDNLVRAASARAEAAALSRQGQDKLAASTRVEKT